MPKLTVAADTIIILTTAPAEVTRDGQPVTDKSTGKTKVQAEVVMMESQERTELTRVTLPPSSLSADIPVGEKVELVGLSCRPWQMGADGGRGPSSGLSYSAESIQRVGRPTVARAAS